MNVPSIYEVLDFEPQERGLSLLADVTIGMVLADPSKQRELEELRKAFYEELKSLGAHESLIEVYWESVMSQRADDVRWRDLLLEVGSDIRESRRAIVMADLCLEANTVDYEDLTNGPAARRLNAILDILDVPFASQDVQGFHLSMTENLATLKSNWVHEAGAFGASVAGGFASGFFLVPSINTATQKGVEFAMGHVQKADPFDVAVADLLACAVAADASSGGDEDFFAIVSRMRDLALDSSKEFGRHREISANVYTGSSAEADRHRRVLNGALQVLEEVHPSGDRMVVLEDVAGMPLSAARSLLEAEGFQVVVQSGDRVVFNEHNWIVQKQVGAGKPGELVTPGTEVILTVRK
ncbi:PASTA domain-containing protein [Thauera aminoaromatica]|nr:PASTA domain-containing protein [Thauera aminoaromatica]